MPRSPLGSWGFSCAHLFYLGQVSCQLDSITAVVLVGEQPVALELEAGWEPRCSWLRRQKIIAPVGNRTTIPWTSFSYPGHYSDWATANFVEECLGNSLFGIAMRKWEYIFTTKLERKNVRSCSWLSVVSSGKWGWLTVEYGGKCNWLMWGLCALNALAMESYLMDVWLLFVHDKSLPMLYVGYAVLRTSKFIFMICRCFSE